MANKTNTPSDEFDAFLEIDRLRLMVVLRYREALTRNAGGFATKFYAYLSRFPATATALERFQQQGGDITALTQKQAAHMQAMINNVNDPDYPKQLQAIGAIHHQHAIAPSWIMGAYHLYQEHLLYIVHQSPEILDDDRPLLLDSLNKLLLRDMGMMLEGYWTAATAAVARERDKVEQLQQQMYNLLNNLPQTIWSIDVVGNRPIYLSPSTKEMSPISTELPIPWLTWTVAEDRPKLETAWHEALTGKHVEIESRVNGPDGKLRWFKRHFHPFADASGKIVRIDGTMEEITDAVRLRDRLRHQATTDSLTGLANRALWHDRVAQALAMARRTPAKHVVLMSLDLNRFKQINDSLGHPTGDLVLKQVANRLKDALRDSDTLARLGGDEFSVLLPAEEDERHSALTVSRKIQACFDAPFSVAGNELYLGVSIGIAAFPKDGRDGATLERHADMAMYISKRNGLTHQFYEKRTNPSAKHLRLMSQLKQGLRKQEFQLHFQPKISLSDGRSSGVEALIRWNHPKHGVLLPDSFIPLAEKMNIINDVSDWVLIKALQQFMQWRTLGIDAPVAINVPASSFQDPQFLKNIRTALDVAEAPPESIELEITENTLMSNIDRCTETLKNLSRMGIKIAIDDFGTGYSSLSYLKRLPIDHIKIDRSFVQDMNRDDSDAAIVRSVIDLGHNLGIKVIAEGVEHQDSLALLRNLGCDAAQGYHIGRPMPAPQVDGWLKQAALIH
ncbi:MAG: EAL domain-containing protein [Gammaproteobacteria bacterium]|jgi:diguanylate cyclase (GGDEF)-like protein